MYKLRHQLKRIIVRSSYYRLPDFLIIGAQKAGTTLLYSLLAQHPQVVEPAFKEAHFFDRDDLFQLGIAQYGLNFELPYKFSATRVTFEATPDYLYYEKCSRRIYELLPNIKLIAVLRDPVERAYSAWKMHHITFLNHHRHGSLYDSRSFRQAVEEERHRLNNQSDIFSYVSRGLYQVQLLRYAEKFGASNILIIDSEDLRTKLNYEFQKVTSFLGLSSFDVEAVSNSRIWANIGPATSEMDEDIGKELEAIYEQPNRDLVDMCNRSFSWI